MKEILISVPWIIFFPIFPPNFSGNIYLRNLNRLGINIPREKWFTNLTTVGNVAGFIYPDA